MQAYSEIEAPPPYNEFTEKQSEAKRVLGGKAKHVMLFGGSRSGKTFTAIYCMVFRALAAPMSRHAVLRFRFNHVKSSVVLDTFPKVMRLCFPEYEYKLDKTDFYAQFQNGSEIWFGGLDDKERSEKILGQEYATIFLNECSQIPWSSRNISITRLAQKCTTTSGNPLSLRMYYDCNPPSQAHWAYKVFKLFINPDDRKPLKNQSNYDSILMNPADNAVNLPDGYIGELEDLPTRQRQRFLEGKFSSVTDNALWTDDVIDMYRVTENLPDFQRIIIGVDPSGADDDENKNNDDIGIVVGALGTDGNGYILEDLTLNTGPAGWGKVTGSAFDRHGADLVVGEANYGGAMVKFVVQTARPGTPYKAVTATRGKVVRAEPISALTEQGKIRFVGNFPELEAELVDFTTTGFAGERSPNRADAFIWVMSELFPGMTRKEKKEKKPRARHNYGGEAGWMAA